MHAYNTNESGGIFVNRYLIGAFSKRCGLSTDTLRYYEKKNLLRTKHEADNDYRYYTDRDLLTVMNICAMRSIDVPVSKLSHDQSPHTLDGAQQQYGQRIAELNEEISRLTAQRDRLVMLEQELRECRERLNMPEDAICRHTWRMTYPDGELTPSQADLIEKWMAHMPHVHLSFRTQIPENFWQLDGNTRFDAQISIGVLAKYVEQFSLPTQGARLSGGWCVARSILCVSDPFAPKASEIEPIMRYIRDTGRAPSGFIQYRLRYIDHTHGSEPLYYLAAVVPIKSDDYP